MKTTSKLFFISLNSIKKSILYSMFFAMLILMSGCKKEQVCSDMPDGLYEGWFTDNGSTPQYIPLRIMKIDDITWVINSSGDPTFGPYTKRDKCYIGGVIEGKSCIGEIQRKNGKYSIKGTYSYGTNSGGQGNPNLQFYEVKGTFEIRK